MATVRFQTSYNRATEIDRIQEELAYLKEKREKLWAESRGYSYPHWQLLEIEKRERELKGML